MNTQKRMVELNDMSTVENVDGEGVKGGFFFTLSNVRSQAEKRLETQRKDLTRNWAG